MTKKKTCTIHYTRAGGEPYACYECQSIVRLFKDGDSIAVIAGRTDYPPDAIERRIREWMRQFDPA